MGCGSSRGYYTHYVCGAPSHTGMFSEGGEIQALLKVKDHNVLRPIMIKMASLDLLKMAKILCVNYLLRDFLKQLLKQLHIRKCAIFQRFQFNLWALILLTPCAFPRFSSSFITTAAAEAACQCDLHLAERKRERGGATFPFHMRACLKSPFY